MVSFRSVSGSFALVASFIISYAASQTSDFFLFTTIGTIGPTTIFVIESQEQTVTLTETVFLSPSDEVLIEDLVLTTPPITEHLMITCQIATDGVGHCVQLFSAAEPSATTEIFSTFTSQFPVPSTSAPSTPPAGPSEPSPPATSPSQPSPSPPPPQVPHSPVSPSSPPSSAPPVPSVKASSDSASNSFPTTTSMSSPAAAAATKLSTAAPPVLPSLPPLNDPDGGTLGFRNTPPSSNGDRISNSLLDVGVTLVIMGMALVTV